MRGTGLVGLLVVLIVAVAATPAAAAPTLMERTPGGALIGPELSGDSLFYGEVGSKRLVLRTAQPTGRFKLASLAVHRSSSGEDEEESPGDFTNFSSQIAASSDRLAYKEALSSGNARYQVGNSSLALFSGRLNGPFAKTDSCGHGDYHSPASAALDVDGPRVAATDCTGRIVIRDHSGAQPTERTVDPGAGLAVGTLALAGRYVAYNANPIGPTGTSPTTTVVRDWTTGATLYEIERVSDFDLQGDGTLAVSTGRIDDTVACNGKLAWYSAAEPTEHVLLSTKPCTSDVRIAAGRIAAVAAGADPEDRVIAVTELNGARTDVVDFGTASTQRGTIDYDGVHVGFAVGNCGGGADLYMNPVAAPAVEPRNARCPVRIHSKSTSLGRSARGVPVRLECTIGCEAVLVIRMRVAGRTVVAGSRRFRIPTALEPTVCQTGIPYEVKLASAARSEIRRRRSVSGTLTVAARNVDGTERVTKRKLTIRASGTRKAQGCSD